MIGQQQHARIRGREREDARVRRRTRVAALGLEELDYGARCLGGGGGLGGGGLGGGGLGGGGVGVGEGDGVWVEGAAEGTEEGLHREVFVVDVSEG